MTGKGRQLRGPRRRGARLLVALVSLSLVPPASAHRGTVHGGVPHLVLLLLFLGGATILGTVAALDRWGNRWNGQLSSRALGVGVVSGISLTALGAVGLVELQVEPLASTPLTREFYPALTFFGGMAIVAASLVLYTLRWGDRHAFPILGTVLGLWVAYPELVPRGAVFHPLGYALVLAMPLALALVYLTAVHPAVQRVDVRARRIGGLAAAGFTAFFVVSSGLLSFNPDAVPQAGGDPFVVLVEFASPLVMWPAVEAYWPSVPLFAALSVGTALVVATLASLVGVNAALGATVWQQRSTESGAKVSDGGTVQGVTGALATTGATACCCCGPALYGIASAAFGASASPLYWAFTDPESPVATVFLVGAIGLLTANAVTLAENVCDSSRT
ncbi:hypothetical protein [Haloarchaeobius sp. TZWWS8]|uniref:hypothetical protein n=1 Tax=Haloarchaeobius sp. TZWWS8 TaxID=3446121 RepID=UPI003EBF3CD5